MTYEQYAAQQIAELENTPLTEISAERYNDMLEVLPPMRWTGGDGFESFFLCEALIADWHDQFMELRIAGVSRYFTKPRTLDNAFTRSDLVQAINELDKEQ